jgi:hypothetical protein
MLAFLVRHRLLAVATVAVIGAGWFLWYNHPARRLQRTWSHLLETVAARQIISLRAILAPDYSDRWGHDRDLIVLEAREAFRQMESIRIRPEEVRTTRGGDEAVITAIIRIDVDGPPPIPEARATVNALFSPFEFNWRKEPGYLGAWQLVRFNHPEFPLDRYRRRASGLF